MNYVQVSAIAIAACLIGYPALAQTPPSDEAVESPDTAQADAAQGDEVTLEEIIITGDRPGFGAGLVQVGTFRNARIIDVPLTVNVVPKELLNAQAATGLFDALRNTPGVSRSQIGGSAYDNVAIRGILVENRGSYRLNGSLPVVNLVDLPLENKDRVEVLKGVGALYYGYAPPSGIVNMVTKRPTQDLLGFTASVNEHGGVNTTIDASRRFGDNFGVRFNGGYGIVETGSDRYDGIRYIAAIAADLDVSDALSFKFDAEHIRKDVTEVPAITAPAPGSILVPPVVPGRRQLPPLPRPSLNLGGKNFKYDAYATNFLARADLRLSRQFALTLEGGQGTTVRDRFFSTFGNYDLRPGSANFGNGTLTVFRTKDARFRNRNVRGEVAGAFPTGPVVHNLIVGATTNWRFQNSRNSTSVSFPQNYFDPVHIVAPQPTVFTVAPVRTRDSGIYAVDRAKLGPVELLAGVRYSDYRAVSTAVNGTVTSFEAKKWTPSYGLIYKPIKTISLYATYLEGLEETPPAPLDSAFPGATLPASTSEQYEVGIKGEVLRAMVFQLAGFQITRASAFTDPVDNVFKLAGRARYRGIEGSFTGELSRELSLNLTGQYLRARVITAVPASLIGTIPENTPEWTASLFAEYRPEALNGFAIGGGAFYVSERPINPQNNGFIGGYTTYSASLRYTLENIGQGNVTLQLNADNLTNARYWGGAGGNTISYGAPRTIKFTTRVAF